MKRRTDAEILLQLIGEECDCCDCEHQQGSVAGQEAAPTRPQMLGKKMPPLTVIDTEQLFVPALFPERESPQLPEPNHLPTVRPTSPPTYSQTELTGEVGFEIGLLLDDGTLDPRLFGSIDHLERVARMWNGPQTSEATYDAPGYVVRSYTRNQLDALPVSTSGRGTFISSDLDLPPGVRFTVENSITAERVQDSLVEIAGVGRCWDGGVTLMRGGTTPVSVARRTDYQEEPGRHFNGLEVPQEAIVTQESLTVAGATLDVLSNVNTSQEIDLQGNNNARHIVGTTEARRGASDLRMIQNVYVDINGELQQPIYLLDAAAPLTHRMDFWVRHRDAAHEFELVNLSVTADGTRIGTGLFYGTGAPLGPATDTTFEDGRPVTWQEFTPVPIVGFALESAPPSPPRPRPDLSFRSPVLSGRGFELHLKPPELRDDVALEPGCLLDGMELTVAGSVLSGTWESFASFRTVRKTLTLLLATEAMLTVIPDLDVGRRVDTSTATLLHDLGYPSAQMLRVGGHLGYHSYPEDRAYLLIEQGEAEHWLAVGEWDAYRDVSAEGWKLAGLSKPRTRALFEAGHNRSPPALLPPRPAHGLALLDLFPAQTGGL